MADENKKDNDHWLVRPSSIRKMIRWSIIILMLLTAADFFVERKGNFGLDGIFGFGSAFGLISCIALVLFSKALGVFLKRPDTYYDR